MAEKVPSWLGRLLLPKLSEISGDIKALNARIDSLEKTMNTRFETVNARIGYLQESMNARFEAVNTRIDSLEKRMPVIEELTAIKIRLADLEKRVTSVEA